MEILANELLCLVREINQAAKTTFLSNLTALRRSFATILKLSRLNVMYTKFHYGQTYLRIIRNQINT